MAQAAVTRAVVPRATTDRIFYSGMAIVMALTVFIGFARTYFLSAFFGTNSTISGRPFSPLIRIHGALFTSWVVLFIVQTALVARHRVNVHRKLGIAGGVLAACMLVAGTALAINGTRSGATAPGVPPLAFLAIPLGDMLMFGIFIACALWWRAKKEHHKRFMLLAYISILAAAVARWPGVLPLGPFGFYGFTMIFLVSAVVYDIVTRRRVHPVYLWGGTALVASIPLRLMISGTQLWQRFAAALIGS